MLPSEMQIAFKWKDAFNKMTSFFANGKISLSMFKIHIIHISQHFSYLFHVSF